jgi:hypothetical protein
MLLVSIVPAKKKEKRKKKKEKKTKGGPFTPLHDFSLVAWKFWLSLFLASTNSIS